jgi:hypothetical protein
MTINIPFRKPKTNDQMTNEIIAPRPPKGESINTGAIKSVPDKTSDKGGSI